MIDVFKTYIPGFGFEGHQNQYPVCIYYVLSSNDRVGDCAVYEGVAPADADDAMILTIKAGGNKVAEHKAREMFPIIGAQNLRYRR